MTSNNGVAVSGIEPPPARRFGGNTQNPPRKGSAHPSVLALRTDPDEDHNRDRSVLCEPVSKFSMGGRRPNPSKFLSREHADGMLVQFSADATNLMAERARHTYGLMRTLAAELARWEVVPLMKLGYRVDGAQDDNSKEHLWFTVNAFHDDHVEATLENDPIAVSALKKGRRSSHDLDLLSDWVILTPAGPITPRDTSPARDLRSHASGNGG